MAKELNIPKWEPVSIESEQGLLGAILINNDAFNFVSDFLQKEHFFEPIHGEIYEVMASLIQMGKPATPQSLMVFLPDGLVREDMSVRAYVAHLAAEATTILNARDYGLNIRDLALHRRAIDIGAEMQRHVPRQIGEFSAEAISELDEIVSLASADYERPVSIGRAVASAVDAAAKAYELNGAIPGLTWGLKALDAKTLGMHGGDLIILAGRPGMGKTALALGVARQLAMAGHPGVMFSVEMGAEQLGQRMLSDELFDNGPITYSSLRAGRFSEDQFMKRIRGAAERLAGLPVEIETKADMTVAQIVAKARRYHRKKKLQWIVIDYLQLIKVPDRYRGNRVLEIGEITSTLKRLAKELNVPVILLSQLNRMVEARDDKRPTMADLRESGNIEQDADVIVMLYREAYYLERSQPKNARMDSEEYASWQIRMNQHRNLLDVIIEKQRQGPIGTVKVFCDIASNAVRDLQEVEGGAQ